MNYDNASGAELYSKIRNDAQSDVKAAVCNGLSTSEVIAYQDFGSPVKFHEVSTERRNHEVLTITDFIEAVKHYNVKDKDSEKSLGVVWVNNLGLEFVVNDLERRDFVVLRFESHSIWDKIQDYRTKKTVSQLELINLLKREFKNCKDQAQILAAVRSLEWRESTSASSRLNTGEESLGREFQRNVSGAGKLPDEISIMSPVLHIHGEEEPLLFNIDLTVNCNLEQQSFTIEGFREQIDSAVLDSLDDIATKLARELDGVKVFLGSRNAGWKYR